MQDQSDDRLLHLIHALAKVTIGDIEKIPRSDKDDPTESTIVMFNLTVDFHKWRNNDMSLFTPEEFLRNHSEIRLTLNKQLQIVKTNVRGDKLLKEIDSALLKRPVEKILHKDSHYAWEQIKEKLPLDYDEHLKFNLQLRGPNGQTIKAYCSMDHSEFTDGYYSLICYLPIVESGPQDKKEQTKKQEVLYIQDRPTIDRLKEYIWKYLDRPLPTNDELAFIFKTDRTTLIRKFKKVFGRTPRQYHRKIRLERAQYELRNSEKQVSAIAREFGFKSDSHFSALYQKTYERSPKKDQKLRD